MTPTPFSEQTSFRERLLWLYWQGRLSLRQVITLWKNRYPKAFEDKASEESTLADGEPLN